MHGTLGLILLIIAMGCVDFSLRYSFFFLFRNKSAPGYVADWLPYIPAAALSALIAPAVFGAKSGAPFTPTPQMIAWLLAAFIAWRTRNAFLTILGGMVALWVGKYLLG